LARPDNQATETLHEIESIFDRVAQWVGANPIPVLVIIGAILASAAGIGGFRAWSSSREADAAADLAEIQTEYRRAMGAPAGSFDIPEPANAEAAAATRQEFATRFAEAAERRSGTAASVSAWLEAGRLREALGDAEAARAAREAAVAEASADSVLGALAQTELAASLERAGEASQAAERYLAAGQVTGFPARILALGDAARCFADAGEPSRALETFALLGEDEVAKLPAHVRARLEELRATTPEP